MGVVSCGGQIRAALELAEVFHYRAALRTSGSPCSDTNGGLTGDPERAIRECERSPDQGVLCAELGDRGLTTVVM